MSNFNIVQYVSEQESFFMPALSSDKIKWSKESQFAIQALGSNEYLTKIATQNPISLQNAIVNIAAIGITLNPASKLAYLVPRKGGVCLDISYMGLIHLAQETGSIEFCQAVIVCKNDTYKRHGIDSAPQHDYEPFGDRGEPVGVYCTVKLPSGNYLTGEMSKADVEAIRNRSEGWKAGKNTPWKTDALEMWKKTVVKRESKYWPKVDRLDKAIYHLNTDGGEGVINNEKDVTPYYDNPIEKLSVLLKGRDEVAFLGWISKAYKKDITNIDQLTEEQASETILKLENAKQ